MLLDRIYQLAAASFVAFIPLTVVVATMVDNGGNSVAEQMVRRFDLRGTPPTLCVTCSTTKSTASTGSAL